MTLYVSRTKNNNKQTSLLVDKDEKYVVMETDAGSGDAGRSVDAERRVVRALDAKSGENDVIIKAPGCQGNGHTVCNKVGQHSTAISAKLQMSKRAAFIVCNHWKLKEKL